jgi:hypothetical protein
MGLQGVDRIEPQLCGPATAEMRGQMQAGERLRIVREKWTESPSGSLCTIRYWSLIR